MMKNKNREARSSLLPLYLKNHSVGKVHSKFSRGLNIQFGDYLIYISTVESPLSAIGFNIEEEKLEALLNSVTIDDIVINKDQMLNFYNVYGNININYKEVDETDLKVPKIKCSTDRIACVKLFSYLEQLEFEKLIGLELDETARQYIKLLLNSDKEVLDTNSAIIRYFSGRGKGLTPSGDDILTGFTLALMTFNDFRNWNTALEASITKAATTVISAAYLRALLAGYASEPFIELLGLFEEEDINAIKEAVKKVQAIGHTSGNDSLFGFFLGLKYLVNKLEG